MGKIQKIFELSTGYIRNISGYSVSLPLLLLLQFGLHLFFYFNTESFKNISEAGALLGALDRIREGERPLPLYGFYWYLTPAYIAFILETIFGTPDAYYIFQCLLSVATTWIIYKIVLLVSGSEMKGIFAVLLVIFYLEFTLLSSVFYNQVYEILFSSMFLWFSTLLCKEAFFKRTILYISLIVISVLLSLLFRSTLIYTFLFFIVAGILMLLFRRYNSSFKFVITGIILFCFVFVINPWKGLREGEFRPESPISFWGHTLYGGNGGEVGFIYKKNEELFNIRLKDYLEERNKREITPEVVEDFKNYEVKRFITREPHRWIFLQIKKVLYTFGIMPQRDSLTMLITGKIPMNWMFASILLQVSFVLIILLFIMSADLKLKVIAGISECKFLIYLLGFYLIGAISVYSAYAERYRIVAVVTFIIPIIAINTSGLKNLVYMYNMKENRKRLFLVLFFIMVWCYQAFEALVIHRERYFQALEKIY